MKRAFCESTSKKTAKDKSISWWKQQLEIVIEIHFIIESIYATCDGIEATKLSKIASILARMLSDSEEFNKG